MVFRNQRAPFLRKFVTFFPKALLLQLFFRRFQNFLMKFYFVCRTYFVLEQEGCPHHVAHYDGEKRGRNLSKKTANVFYNPLKMLPNGLNQICDNLKFFNRQQYPDEYWSENFCKVDPHEIFNFLTPLEYTVTTLEYSVTTLRYTIMPFGYTVTSLGYKVAPLVYKATPIWCTVRLEIQKKMKTVFRLIRLRNWYTITPIGYTV